MNPSGIAIVGMAGRFPGAENVARFWQNLRDGVESIRDRSDAELLAAGATPEDLANPDYVRRASILDGVPLFDAAFFGFSPRDAAIMDPQHRHFLECAWEALEDAAHPPQRFAGSIAVFCGSGMNSYLIHNLLANRKLLASAGLFQLKQTGNDKDVLATRVSYQLDLRGPSINVQTACSTSLVAVHLACQSLLNQECDMALAGGVTIEIPHGTGYTYHEGEILSRDGHCRAFDSQSSGTVFSSGLGIVVLRRLEDALADGDNIRAVILGSAINNDGARKVGYLAPSVEGQAEVIAEALDFAGVSADEIAYVETHGTGTIVGDPIEVRALTQTFRRASRRTGYCGIGSLKSNIGHLDAAAGVAGLIKTALALENRQLPPSLHFRQINPHIAIEGSPFYVNSTLRAWPESCLPRRAGVTSLGIGGTNAHVVLEEAPQRAAVRQQRPFQLLTVSAKTASAADRAFANLAEHLRDHPEIALADAAFTCQLGRHAFAHRRALAVEDSPAAVAALPQGKRTQIAAGTAPPAAPETVFLFSGQGSQYVEMGRDLYRHEPVFRGAMDECARLLRSPLGIDLIDAIFPSEERRAEAAGRLNQTWLTQPALFSIEYALAQWWISLGVRPAAMAGHSIGEYVAACLAGVFSLEDALAIVALRGRLIYALPAGSMLAVPLAPEEIELPAALSLAAVNNPRMSVVSGPTEQIAAFEARLAERSIAGRRLVTSHAFHSAMMDPILAEFEERIRAVRLNAPRIPYLSNVSGAWITAQEATSPAYWARHIRSTVRFSDCLAEIFCAPGRVLVEAGPGNVLTTLARQQGGESALAFASLPHPRENTSSLRCALQTLGQLWTLGIEVDWARLHAPGSARRVSLPTYPFERQRFWIEPDPAQHAAPAAPARAPQQQPGEE
ncbi:MAG: type I polyketide synthase, partial [Terracidiphilus sp.]